MVIHRAIPIKCIFRIQAGSAREEANGGRNREEERKERYKGCRDDGRTMWGLVMEGEDGKNDEKR